MSPRRDRQVTRLEQCPGCGRSFAESDLWLAVGSRGGNSEPPWQLSVGSEVVAGTHTGDAALYRLCPVGHFLLDGFRENGAVVPLTLSQRQLVCVIGTPAVGKSYLTVRVCRQMLPRPILRTLGRRRPDIRECSFDWLEELPLAEQREAWGSFEETGKLLAATDVGAMTPDDLLGRAIPTLRDRLVEMGVIVPNTVRQPIVLRYSFGPESGAIAIADLPGEWFSQPATYQEYLRRLQEFDDYVVVFDPVPSPAFRDFLGSELAEGVRASTPAAPDLDTQLVARARRQREVAQFFATHGTLLGATAERRPRRVLVAITKQDLTRGRLRRGGASLLELGSSADHAGRADSSQPLAVEGAADYLLHLAQRRHDGMIEVDGPTGRLLRPLEDRLADPATCLRLARHIAHHFVAGFSGADEFWDLVHRGGAVRICVPAGESSVISPALDFTVPSISTHAGESLDRPGTTSIRDVVMSALGCGLAYAIGYGREMGALLTEGAIEVAFLLTSATEHVPARTDDLGTHVMPSPTDGVSARFPQVDALSAAPLHLLLDLLQPMRMADVRS